MKLSTDQITIVVGSVAVMAGAYFLYKSQTNKTVTSTIPGPLVDNGKSSGFAILDDVWQMFGLPVTRSAR